MEESAVISTASNSGGRPKIYIDREKLGLYIFHGKLFLQFLEFHQKPFKEGLENGISPLFQP